MAHLIRGVGLGLLLAAGGTACDTGDATTRVVAQVFEQPVSCLADGTCVSVASGTPVAGERIDVQGVISSGASTYDPGFYLYAGGFRGNGAFFELELDVSARLGEDSTAFTGLYREYLAGAALFAGDRVTGELEIVPIDGEGGPYGGVFDLQFVDFGEDDTPDTGDDRLRVLRLGFFTLSGREPETESRPREISGVEVHVSVAEDNIDPDVYDFYDDGCTTNGTQTYGDDQGCEGDTSTDPGDGAGCEGDTTGDAGGDGCQGDTYGGESSGSSCQGDTSSGSGGCQGDTLGSDTASNTTRKHRPRRSYNAALPLLALLITRQVLRKR